MREKEKKGERKKKRERQGEKKKDRIKKEFLLFFIYRSRITLKEVDILDFILS